MVSSPPEVLCPIVCFDNKALKRFTKAVVPIKWFLDADSTNVFSHKSHDRQQTTFDPTPRSFYFIEVFLLVVIAGRRRLQVKHKKHRSHIKRHRHIASCRYSNQLAVPFVLALLLCAICDVTGKSGKNFPHTKLLSRISMSHEVLVNS